MDKSMMDIKEFRDKGYLQEVNRRFFHPLGLALEVTISADGVEKLSGVWDNRDDLEGIVYGVANCDKDKVREMKDKAFFVERQIRTRKFHRSEKLGFVREPIFDGDFDYAEKGV